MPMAPRVAPGRTLSWLGIMDRLLAQPRRSHPAQILDRDVEPFDLVFLAANALDIHFDTDAQARSNKPNEVRLWALATGKVCGPIVRSEKKSFSPHPFRPTAGSAQRPSIRSRFRPAESQSASAWMRPAHGDR